MPVMYYPFDMPNETVQELNIVIGKLESDSPLERELRTLGPFIYIIPTMIFQIILVYVIFSSKKKFGNPFYRLVSIGFIVDFVGFLIMPLFNRFQDNVHTRSRFIDFFVSNEHLTTFLFLVYTYVSLAQPLNIFLISINRFTVVRFPVKAQPYWTKYMTAIVVVFVVLPLFFSWQLIYCGVLIFVVPDTFYMVDYYKCMNYPYPSWFTTLTPVITSVINLGLNGNIVFSLWYRQSQYQTNKDISRTEVKLCIYTIVTAFNQFAYGLFMLVIIIRLGIMHEKSDSYDGYILMMRLVPFSFDVTCLTSAWFLLVMSSHIRSHVFGLFGITRFAVNTSVTLHGQNSKKTSKKGTMGHQVFVVSGPVRIID